ncbi:MAG: 3,4-dihydroxy-2-butanone-4-phosphate synthase, partial [Myxococcota bacterium]|nr:3,4-dihydroxy-2-butanone-4-phosphate synthase [Myxococcota bacterium]
MSEQNQHAGNLTASIETTTEAIRRGRVVMIVDPVRPERGGILVAAAERVTDDIVNFMATHARAIVAVALAPARIERMGLRLQGPWVSKLDRENYTTSIEAREGVSTGISAADRARTVRAVADFRTRPEDLSVPGHIFPTQGDPQGLLGREGWSEACLDLARLAGAEPAMAFCQILDEAGEIAGAEHLSNLADHHGIPCVGIAGLISYRMSQETFVTQRIQATLPTRHGELLCRVFENRLDGKEHLAYTLGE